MKTMKMRSLLAVVLLVATLAGCGGKQAGGPQTGNSQTGSNPSQASSAAEPSTPEVKVLKYSTHFSKGVPQVDSAYVFADEVNKNCDTLRVEVYENNALGGGVETIEYVQRGTVEIGGTTLSNFSGFTKKFLPLSLPYIFTGREQAYEFLDSDFGESMKSAIVEDQNIIFVAWFENGIRHIFNNKRPIYTPDDVKGLKIRVQENPVQLKTIEALGGLATPMAMNEQFTALQQGQIDGAENSYPNILNNKLYEVSKYISETGHFYEVSGIFMNAEFYESLTDEEKEAIQNAAKVATKYNRERNIAEDDKVREELKKYDVEINALTDEQILAFKDATSSVKDWLLEQNYDPYNKEILDAIDQLN